MSFEKFLTEGNLQAISDISVQQLTVEAMGTLIAIISVANEKVDTPKDFFKRYEVVKSAITKADSGHIKIAYTYKDKLLDHFFADEFVLKSINSNKQPLELNDESEAKSHKFNGLTLKTHSHVKA